MTQKICALLRKRPEPVFALDTKLVKEKKPVQRKKKDAIGKPNTIVRSPTNS
jgi:hypothetical protein